MLKLQYKDDLVGQLTMYVHGALALCANTAKENEIPRILQKIGNFALVHILGRYLTASLSFTWSQFNIFHIFTIFINQLVHLKVHIVHICFPVKILDFGSWCSFIFQRIATAAFILADLLHLIVVLYILLAFSGKQKIQTTVSRICKMI